MPDLNLLFLGTAPFALPSLQRLYESEFCPSAVITRPDRPSGRGKKILSPPVKSTAQTLGLRVLQPSGKKGLFEILEQFQPRLLVNVAYGMILPPYILDYPKMGCINVHPSLLPAYRGATPIRRAIMAGDELTGVSVMYMAEEMDAGDIIIQEEVHIHQGETYGHLHDRLSQIGAHLLLDALKMVAGGSAPKTPQNKEKATYAPPLSPADELINWTRPAFEIYNQVRGLAPSPGAYTWFNEKRLKVSRVTPVEKNNMPSHPTGDFSPGTVCMVEKDRFWVAAGKGFIQVLELQPEGKKRIQAEDFLRGYSLQVGETLG